MTDAAYIALSKSMAISVTGKALPAIILITMRQPYEARLELSCTTLDHVVTSLRRLTTTLQTLTTRNKMKFTRNVTTHYKLSQHFHMMLQHVTKYINMKSKSCQYLYKVTHQESWSVAFGSHTAEVWRTPHRT